MLWRLSGFGRRVVDGFGRLVSLGCEKTRIVSVDE